jgi:hypothetical protein
MRWATYERIVELAEQAEEDRGAALMPAFYRLLERVSRSRR